MSHSETHETVAHQVPLPLEFFCARLLSRLPIPPPRDPPDPGTKLRVSVGMTLWTLSHLGISDVRLNISNLGSQESVVLGFKTKSGFFML